MRVLEWALLGLSILSCRHCTTFTLAQPTSATTLPPQATEAAQFSTTNWAMQSAVRGNGSSIAAMRTSVLATWSASASDSRSAPLTPPPPLPPSSSSSSSSESDDVESRALVAAFRAALPAGATTARRWHVATQLALRAVAADPTRQARDLFHISATMFEAWRAVREPQLPELVPGASRASGPSLSLDEVLAHAVHRVLHSRLSREARYKRVVPLFADALNAATLFDLRIAERLPPAYDVSVSASTRAGRLIGDAVIEWAAQDGACEATDYKCVDDPYVSANRHHFSPFWQGVGRVSNVNRWQRMIVGTFIDKSGVEIDGYPDFTTPSWGRVRPYALNESDLAIDVFGEPRDVERDASGKPVGLYFDPGPPPQWGPDSVTHEAYIGNYSAVAKFNAWNTPHTSVEWSVSPANHSLGSNTVPFEQQNCDARPGAKPCANVGVGHEVNPATAAPYAQQTAVRGDYASVLAEFWADGPESDTPPRHWNAIFDDLMDHGEFAFQFGGVGRRVPRLEFEIKAYLVLNGALHDCAIATWGVKRHYDSVRPITAIRFMSSLGQSSDPDGVSYHPGGLRLIPGTSFSLEATDVCRARCDNYSAFENHFGSTPGPLARLGFDRINRTIVRTWQANGQTPTAVDFFAGERWHPFRRPGFVSPPFGGYVSGHSSFARTAADTLTRLTGDPFFPGGYYGAIARKDRFLVLEDGPSRDTPIGWATYSDAANECSLSRIYVGVHPPHDDVGGRRIGRLVAERAWRRSVHLIGAAEPDAARIAVRVQLAGGATSFAEAFGSESAVAAWARSVATAAMQGVAPAEGPPYNVRVWGRGPLESLGTRTIVVRNVRSEVTSLVAERIAATAASHSKIAAADVLMCDSLACREAPRDVLSPDAVIGIVLAIAALVLALMGLALVILHRQRRWIFAHRAGRGGLGHQRFVDGGSVRTDESTVSDSRAGDIELHDAHSSSETISDAVVYVD